MEDSHQKLNEADNKKVKDWFLNAFELCIPIIAIIGSLMALDKSKFWEAATLLGVASIPVYIALHPMRQTKP
ncbi:MAG: hypothetical protein AAF696_29145 [Bacteroidota bacterium]